MQGSSRVAVNVGSTKPHTKFCRLSFACHVMQICLVFGKKAHPEPTRWFPLPLQTFSKLEQVQENTRVKKLMPRIRLWFWRKSHSRQRASRFPQDAFTAEKRQEQIRTCVHWELEPIKTDRLVRFLKADTGEDMQGRTEAIK